MAAGYRSRIKQNKSYPHDYSLYEGIDHISKKGNGAKSFRAGISSIRIALFNMFGGNRH